MTQRTTPAVKSPLFREALYYLCKRNHLAESLNVARRHVKCKLFFLVMFLSVLLPEEARLSGSIPQEITLDDIIEKSVFIVHVKKRVPFQEKNKAEELLYQFSVIENLGKRSAIPKGENIEVGAALAPTNIPEGKWAYDYFYRPTVSLDKQNEFILFLVKDGNHYRFTCKHAYEGIDKKQLILEKLNK